MGIPLHLSKIEKITHEIYSLQRLLTQPQKKVFLFSFFLLLGFIYYVKNTKFKQDRIDLLIVMRVVFTEDSGIYFLWSINLL